MLEGNDWKKSKLQRERVDLVMERSLLLLDLQIVDVIE